MLAIELFRPRKTVRDPLAMLRVLFNANLLAGRIDLDNPA